MNFEFIDVHTHLHGKEFDADRNAVLKKLKEGNIAAITIGTDYEESEKAVLLAKEEPCIFAAVGIHPVDRMDAVFEKERFETLAKNPKVVAIGECGLDYYWPSRNGWKEGEEKEKDRQRELFTSQIQIACELDLPLMIHGRGSVGSMDAYEDILKILFLNKQIYTDKLRGDIHFFAGTREIAKAFLGLGFTMSFTGVITFSRDYDEVLQTLPLSAILAETDSPYATPTPHRGKRNDSSFIPLIYQKIALIRGEDIEIVKKTIQDNAKKLFKV